MEKTMTDLMQEVANPIATGAIIMITAFAVSWLLGLVGFVPLLIVDMVLTLPGIPGFLAVSWVIGKIVPKIPKFVEDLL